MNQEFGWRSPLYSVAGFHGSGTAALRVMNNRHWVSNVIAGAGIVCSPPNFAIGYTANGKTGNIARSLFNTENNLNIMLQFKIYTTLRRFSSLVLYLRKASD